MQWHGSLHIGAGLQNLGNTCFMNSVPPLRDQTATEKYLAGVAMFDIHDTTGQLPANMCHLLSNRTLLPGQRACCNAVRVITLHIAPGDGAMRDSVPFCALRSMQQHIAAVGAPGVKVHSPDRIARELRRIARHFRLGRQEARALPFL